MRAVGWLVMALGLLRYPSAVQVRWIRNALLVAAKEASLGRALHVPGFELDPALVGTVATWMVEDFCTKKHPRDEVEKFPCEKMGEFAAAWMKEL